MLPTRAIRNNAPPPGGELANRKAVPKRRRAITIKAGQISLSACLLDTPTAQRIWYALPIWTTAEQWGTGALHFSTHINTGRERTAQWNVDPGDIAYWVEDDRVIIGYDMTPLSRPGEIRLPSPGNIWARTEDDVAQLRQVTPGTRLDMTMLVLPEDVA